MYFCFISLPTKWSLTLTWVPACDWKINCFLNNLKRRKNSCLLPDIGTAFLSYQAECLIKVAGSQHVEWEKQEISQIGLALKKVLCRCIGNEEEILNIIVYRNSKQLPENFKMLLTKIKMYMAFSKHKEWLKEMHLCLLFQNI